MDTESKEKVKTKRKGNIKAIMLKDIPRPVHNVIKKYQLKIGGERGRFFDIKEAYVEYLIDVTKTHTI